MVIGHEKPRLLHWSSGGEVLMELNKWWCDVNMPQAPAEIVMIMIIINLICIAQFDTNGILTALKSVSSKPPH